MLEEMQVRCRLASTPLLLTLLVVLLLLVGASIIHHVSLKQTSTYTHRTLHHHYMPCHGIDGSSSSSVRLLAESERREGKGGQMNYGIVIDAGSSGSRLYVYTWPPHDGDASHLIRIMPLLDKANGQPIVEKITPGLATFTGVNASNVSTYMIPLLSLAARHIPLAQHAATPLYIYATAGMRLIPKTDQDTILSTLRRELPRLFAFHMVDEHIGVIDGQTEGVYSWIAINYILGKFHHDPPPHVELPSKEGGSTSTTRGGWDDRPPTVGMIDMGGASLQIAYEAKAKVPYALRNYVKHINLGCGEHDTQHEYTVFVVTFLELGANEALQRYESMLDAKAKRLLQEGVDDVSDTALRRRRRTSENHKHNHTLTVHDPCMPQKHITLVHLDEQTTYNRRGTGNYSKCLTDIVPLLDKGEGCGIPPCSMREIRQGEMADLSEMQLYGFSEYWYSQYDILALKGDYNYTLLREKATDFCATSWSVLKRRADKKMYPRSDRARLRTQCFKSAWISQVLHEGFGVSRRHNHFRTVQSVDGQEVQWTLGALLHQMRYFPLRDMERARLAAEHDRHPEHGTRRWTAPVLLLLICVVVILLGLAKYAHMIRRTGKGGETLPRSHYSYMMLSEAQEKFEHNNYKNVRADYIY